MPLQTEAEVSSNTEDSVTKGNGVTIYTSNGSLVPLPNVVGQKLSDAQKALSQFSVKVTGGSNKDGIVEAMDPGAGTPAKPGSTVTLKIAAAEPSPGVGK